MIIQYQVVNPKVNRKVALYRLIRLYLEICISPIEGRGEGEEEGRRRGSKTAWGSGMIEMEKGWICEQGRRYLN